MQVYDVSSFMDDHPGGDEVLISATGKISHSLSVNIGSLILNTLCTVVWMRILFGIFAGKDATNDFEDVGHSDSAREMMDKYYIGDIDPSTVPRKRAYIPPQQPAYNQDKTPEFIIKILQILVPLLILGLAFAVRHYTKKE